MRRRLIRIGAPIVLVAALAGGGVAWATAGDDDEQVTGPAAERARAAALAQVGGRVTGVEREGSGWEVEVERSDGTTAEVVLDAGFHVVGVEGEEDEDDEDGD